jgi:hypothetical protein
VEALTADEKSRLLSTLLDAHLELVGEAAERAEAELGAVKSEAIAGAVARTLGALDIEDAWDRSGQRAHGEYVEETEATWAVIEEAIEPFLADLRRRLVLGRWDEADALCQGVLLGLDRLAVDPTELLADHAPDALDELAWLALDTWKKPPKGARRRGARRNSDWSAMRCFVGRDLHALQPSLIRALGGAPARAKQRAARR